MTDLEIGEEEEGVEAPRGERGEEEETEGEIADEGEEAAGLALDAAEAPL